MPSPASADRQAAEPPQRRTVEALITQTRRLRGGLDAIRRQALKDEQNARGRWQRALFDLAAHQLNDLDGHLEQLRDGPEAAPPEQVPQPRSAPSSSYRAGPAAGRIGSAEWDLATDEAHWSGELYEILGHSPAAPPLTLDELPSLVQAEDQPGVVRMVTACLVDGRPIDGEFRVPRSDGSARTVHMTGEPVFDADGSTAAMWAVLRDVSELRRGQRAVSESRDSLTRQGHLAQKEHRLAAELQEAVLPPWHGCLQLPRIGPAALELSADSLPAPPGTPVGGNWYDALELPDGQALLSVGDLSGHGVGATSGMAVLLGALRGMAVAGLRPDRIMSGLSQLLDASGQPALGSAVCCRYTPRTRILTWAGAGHPAPLLFRGGTGRPLTAPAGALLGAMSGASYEQAEAALLSDDVLLLYTDGLVTGHTGTAAQQRLLALAPRFAEARTAQECLRTVAMEFGGSAREDDASVLIVRVVD